MKNNLGKIFSIGLAALLLAPAVAQAQNKFKIMEALHENAGKGIVKALEVQSKKLSKTIDAVAQNAEKEAAQYIRGTYRVEVPSEHFLRGSQVQEETDRIFRQIHGDIVDLQVEKITRATGHDVFVTQANEAKLLSTKPGDVILQPSSLPYPIVMSQETFAELYRPIKGMPNLALRQGNTPMPVEISYITRDWTPAPVRFLRNPDTYKKGDFVVSFYGGWLRRTLPAEEIATYFRGQNISPSNINLLFRTLGPQNTLKFLDIPTGKPAHYAKSARIQARPAQEGEKIVTVLKDGTQETENIANDGDWVVTNPSGEQYIVPGEKFAQKYEPAEELGEGWYKPTGLPQTFIQIHRELKIKASWGEQYLGSGSFLNITKPEDVYGVAEEEFKETYELVK